MMAYHDKCTHPATASLDKCSSCPKPALVRVLFQAPGVSQLMQPRQHRLTRPASPDSGWLHVAKRKLHAEVASHLGQLTKLIVSNLLKYLLPCSTS